MLTAEQIAALRDYAGQLTDPINDYLIRDIAERIAKAGQFTSTAQYQIWAAQQMGLSQVEIKKRLKKLLGVSNDEIKNLLTQSAEVGYRFDLKALPTADAIPFAENHVLQEIVSAAVKLAQDDFTNITQTWLTRTGGRSRCNRHIEAAWISHSLRWRPERRITIPPSGLR